MSPDMREQSKETAEMAKPWQVFSKDLTIVGAADRLVPHSPFEAPPAPWDDHGHHNYHLTVWEGTDGEYQKKLSSIKVAAIGCMDWRFNRALYDEAVNKGFAPEEIMLVTVAGGGAQEPEERQKALGEITKGIYDNAKNLQEVIVSGHADRCGAWAYWLGAGAGELPAPMGTKIGGETEVAEMSRLVNAGMDRLPKTPEGIRVNGMILGLSEMDEEKHQLKVKTIKI